MPNTKRQTLSPSVAPERIKTNPSALRKLILARQGLLAWRGGKGAFAEGALWRDELKGHEGVLQALKRLEAVQLDPVNVIAPNHHLVLGNRVGGYKPTHLEALYPQKQIFEYWAQARCILPIEDWPLFEWRRERWKLEHTLEAMQYGSRSEPYERHVLEAIEYIRQKLTLEGSLPARALDTGKKVRGNWGFTAKASSQAMEHLWWAGEIVVAQRKSDERHFALTHSWLPTPTAHRPVTEPGDGGQAENLLKYIRAYGVFDGSDPRMGWRNWPGGKRKPELEGLLKAKQIIPLEIEGLRSKRTYYLWAELAEMLEGLSASKVSPKVWFLPPLDNLLWRRERIGDLFGFDYKWEIYVPEHKRNYGPYILPMLDGERFIGRLRARMNREQKQLEVEQIFWEVPASQSTWARVKKALEGFADSLGASLSIHEKLKWPKS